MDEYSSKRAAGGLIVPRKGSSISLKDTIIDGDQKAQFCRGIGCSGRIKYSQNTKIRKSDEVKCPKRSFHSSSAKQIIGSSSQTCGVMTNARKSHLDSTRKFPSQPEFYPSESSVLIESEAPELLPSPSRFRSCLKNLKWNSLADVIPGSGSTSELNSSRRDVMKREVQKGKVVYPEEGRKQPEHCPWIHTSLLQLVASLFLIKTLQFGFKYEWQSYCICQDSGVGN